MWNSGLLLTQSPYPLKTRGDLTRRLWNEGSPGFTYVLLSDFPQHQHPPVSPFLGRD